MLTSEKVEEDTLNLNMLMFKVLEPEIVGEDFTEILLGNGMEKETCKVTKKRID